MTCKDCAHYLPSEIVLKPRPGLAGYGYCNAAQGAEARARFFSESRTCWLRPVQFKVKPS